MEEIEFGLEGCKITTGTAMKYLGVRLETGGRFQTHIEDHPFKASPASRVADLRNAGVTNTISTPTIKVIPRQPPIYLRLKKISVVARGVHRRQA